MRTTVQRWGNSLAVRIPKHLAEESRLRQGTHVEVSVREGNLILMPCAQHFTLTRLLAGITKKNLHREVETGPSMGREAW